MKQTYLSFTVDNELFAVNVTKVLEVLQKQSITPVPNAPPFIKGIINFRGEVVPVFESRIKFNLPPRSEDSSFVIIVFDLSNSSQLLRIGAIVDRVRDVITIDDDEIMPVPPMSKSFKAEFIQGIFKLNNHFILLLNIEKVFSDSEIQAIESTNQELSIS